MIGLLIAWIRKLAIGAAIVLLVMAYGDKYIPEGIRFLKVVNDQSLKMSVDNSPTQKEL
ncbi:MAG: hypothetical protein HW380_2010 [Magnetococcales bacterium]|nr:hypothetical protein [Magnetococcales bacterium]HIJ82784.1 hypothetical protein [Magnetococcales bacterium]